MEPNETVGYGCQDTYKETLDKIEALVNKPVTSLDNIEEKEKHEYTPVDVLMTALTVWVCYIVFF